MAIDFRAALMDELDPSQRSNNTGIAGNLAGSGQLPVVGTPIDPTNGGGINGENLPSGAPDAKPAIAAPAADKPDWMTSHSTVNLQGWDPTRTDLDPKMEWGRFIQSRHPDGRGVTTQDIQDFVAADPRWEMQGKDQLRVKQDALNTWKPGRSIWQDASGDVGGEGRASFSNIEGDPALGYAAPQQASTPGGLSGMLAGDPTAGIQSALGGLSKQGDFLTQLLAALQGTAA